MVGRTACLLEDAFQLIQNMKFAAQNELFGYIVEYFNPHVALLHRYRVEPSLAVVAARLMYGGK
jgi:hypothetical protein